jgi:hypothetical protein
LTLAKAGQYLVQGNFFFNVQPGDGGNFMLGALPGFTPVAALSAPTIPAGQSLVTMVSQQWVLTVSAGGSVTLQASKSGGTGNSAAGATHTSISALWVSG